MKRLLVLLLFICFNSFGFSDESAKETVSIDNWIIEITNCDSIDFPGYFEDQQQIDSISKEYEAWYSRVLAIEEYQLNKYKPKIRKDSTARIISLCEGQELSLIPNENMIEVEYAFEKEFKDKDLLLFQVLLFEGNDYFLINTKTGKRTYTRGRVYFSYDGNYMISINDDIDAGYSFNGFQFFRVTENNTLVKLGAYSPNWAPKQLLWTDCETLFIKGYTYSTDGNWEQKTIYKRMKISEM